MDTFSANGTLVGKRWVRMERKIKILLVILKFRRWISQFWAIQSRHRLTGLIEITLTPVYEITLKTALFNSSLRLPHLSTIWVSIWRSLPEKWVNIWVNTSDLKGETFFLDWDWASLDFRFESRLSLHSQSLDRLQKLVCQKLHKRTLTTA